VIGLGVLAPAEKEDSLVEARFARAMETFKALIAWPELEEETLEEARKWGR
jgi:hypothetical protein